MGVGTEQCTPAVNEDMKVTIGLQRVLFRWLRCGAIFLASGFPAALVLAASPDSIVGTWLTEDGASRVEVSVERGTDGSGFYSGKVVWLKEAGIAGKPVLDANNSDATLRGRPIMGIEILSGFRNTAEGVWTGGTVYSPRRGRTYPAELALTPEGRLDIRVKSGLLTTHQIWTR
jgi:uncharacterized protein (DUF2147 family)